VCIKKADIDIPSKILKGLTLLLVISIDQAYRIRELRLTLIHVDGSDTVLFAEMMTYLRKSIPIL